MTFSQFLELQVCHCFSHNIAFLFLGCAQLLAASQVIFQELSESHLVDIMESASRHHEVVKHCSLFQRLLWNLWADIWRHLTVSKYSWGKCLTKKVDMQSSDNQFPDDWSWKINYLCFQIDSLELRNCATERPFSLVSIFCRVFANVMLQASLT